jgi:opacity protein-like surface antigen
MEDIMQKYYYLILVLAVLFCASTVMGQIQLGVVAGVNMANISVSDAEDDDVSYKTQMGFAAGAVASFAINEMFAIQAEPAYIQKGSKLELGDLSSKLKLGYIEIPVLAKVSFGQANAKPYILAGPALGILLSAKEEDVDIKELLKSIDFGINFGAGVSFLMGNNTLFLEGQYGLGLSNILDVEGAETTIKNKGIQIKGGITFPIGS